MENIRQAACIGGRGGSGAGAEVARLLLNGIDVAPVTIPGARCRAQGRGGDGLARGVPSGSMTDTLPAEAGSLSPQASRTR